MNSIISYLVLYNQILIFQVIQLLKTIVKDIPVGVPNDNPLNPKHQKFTVDASTIIKQSEKLDYKDLIPEYKAKHKKEVKPIRTVLLLYLLMLYVFVVMLYIITFMIAVVSLGVRFQILILIRTKLS